MKGRQGTFRRQKGKEEKHQAQEGKGAEERKEREVLTRKGNRNSRRQAVGKQERQEA